MERPDKDNYYLNIALAISKESTCNRRHFGAIIVKEDSIISAGYNGPARGAPNCIDNECLKDKHGMKPGMAYELCRAGPLHAEVNAIINAARGNGGTLDSIMYIAGEYSGKKHGISDSYPCKSCQKEIINAGINEIVIRQADNGIDHLLVKKWITEAKLRDDKDIKGFYG